MITTVKKTSKILLAFMFLFVLSACTRPTGIPQGSDVQLSGEDDDAINLKLKYFNRNCVYIYSDTISMINERYVEAASNDPESINEDNIPSLWELDLPNNCSIAISRAKDLDVAQELDPLAEAFLSELQKAIPVINQAARYYDLMEYKEDDFQKGRELHPELMEVFKAFEKAGNDLVNGIQEAQDALNLRVLEKFKQANSDFEYLLQDAWIKGTALLYQVEALENCLDLNVEEFEEAMNEFKIALEALEAFLLEHPEEAIVAEWYMDYAWQYLSLLNEFIYEINENQSEGNTELIVEECGSWREDVRSDHEWWKDEHFLQRAPAISF